MIRLKPARLELIAVLTELNYNLNSTLEALPPVLSRKQFLKFQEIIHEFVTRLQFVITTLYSYKLFSRMRKLERIAQLDSEVGQLKEQNMQLVKEGDCLRGELRQLKDILK